MNLPGRMPSTGGIWRKVGWNARVGVRIGGQTSGCCHHGDLLADVPGRDHGVDIANIPKRRTSDKSSRGSAARWAWSLSSTKIYRSRRTRRRLRCGRTDRRWQDNAIIVVPALGVDDDVVD